MGLDPEQLLRFVIQPALARLAPFIPYSVQATQLVLGTAITESKLVYIDQIDRAGKPGPAYGLWQMERATYADLFQRMTPELRAVVSSMFSFDGSVDELHGNLYLGAAICRVKYFMTPDRIPVDHKAMAELWKRRYNTYLGAGTVEKALKDFKLACSVSQLAL